MADGGNIALDSKNRGFTLLELLIVLESTVFTVDDNKKAKDGGDNTNYYEVGNSLKLLGTGTNY